MPVTPLPADVGGWTEQQKHSALEERRRRIHELENVRAGDIDDGHLAEIYRIQDDINQLLGAAQEPRFRMVHPTGSGTSRSGFTRVGAFSAEVLKAKWNSTHNPKVVLPPGTGVLPPGVDIRASFDYGGDAGPYEPYRLPTTVLGQDRRYIYPALNLISIPQTATTLTYIRQSARSLADPDLMVRALDSVVTKPETSMTVTLEPVVLRQIASVVTGVPSIISTQPAFRTILDNELRLAVSEALDEMTVDTIDAAGLSMASAGTNLFESARKAITQVEGRGYQPDTIALPPAYSEVWDIDSLTLFNSLGVRPNFGLSVRVSKSLTVPIVFDSTAFATVAIGPTLFAAFPENFGASNSDLYRGEILQAACWVDRPDAGEQVWAS